MVVRKNSKVKKYRGIEEGIVNVDFEDDFVKTEGWKSEVKVDWSKGKDFWWRFRGGCMQKYGCENKGVPTIS